MIYEKEYDKLTDEEKKLRILFEQNFRCLANITEDERDYLLNCLSMTTLLENKNLFECMLRKKSDCIGFTGSASSNGINFSITGEIFDDGDKGILFSIDKTDLSTGKSSMYVERFVKGKDTITRIEHLSLDETREKVFNASKFNFVEQMKNKLLGENKMNSNEKQRFFIGNDNYTYKGMEESEATMALSFLASVEFLDQEGSTLDEMHIDKEKNDTYTTKGIMTVKGEKIDLRGSIERREEGLYVFNNITRSANIPFNEKKQYSICDIFTLKDQDIVRSTIVLLANTDVKTRNMSYDEIDFTHKIVQKSTIEKKD